MTFSDQNFFLNSDERHLTTTDDVVTKTMKLFSIRTRTTLDDGRRRRTIKYNTVIRLDRKYNTVI